MKLEILKTVVAEVIEIISKIMDHRARTKSGLNFFAVKKVY